MTDPNDAADPAAALAAIQASRRAIHDRVASKGWRYDLAYSALIAGMVAGQVLEAPFNITASALGVLGLAVIFQAETRRTGLRVTGISPARARWVAIGLGLAMAVVMLGLVWLKRAPGAPSVGVLAAGAGALTFALALIGSRLWRRVYRAEMGAGA
jgi:hypothetical protein